MSKKVPSADSPEPKAASYNQFERSFIKLVEKAIGKCSDREPPSDVTQEN
jgi:menaquinone-dependent protoporphyrinogen IX oxidase